MIHEIKGEFNHVYQYLKPEDEDILLIYKENALAENIKIFMQIVYIYSQSIINAFFCQKKKLKQIIVLCTVSEQLYQMNWDLPL